MSEFVTGLDADARHAEERPVPCLPKFHFIILPLTLPTLPGLPASAANAKHYLYIKPHAPSIPTPDADRSLFIANVPIDASEKGLRALFSEQLGGAMVERVEFDGCVPAGVLRKKVKIKGGREDNVNANGDGNAKKRKREAEQDMLAEGIIEDADSALPKVWGAAVKRSGSGAVVVFVDRKSCRGAMGRVREIVKEGVEVRWEMGEGVGVDRYKLHTTLTHPPPSTLQSSTNAYLTAFSALESLRSRSRTRSRTVPDEDGFITVTRGGRSGPARLEEAEKKKAELDERRKGVVKDDFYRFQNRERRKEREGELRRRFEEDRRRVGVLRGRGVGRPEV
ncbi:hypothetical protein NX059_009248 [Plenodomus lindquistii]|nr:hypothetical protein NX059_009248 [Plenodomus lindquistii]